jgi:DNA mismatch endonuclease (patch repair protein)
MKAVRSKDTGPEVALRRALFAEGVRGWRCNYRRAPGRPDVAWPGLKVAVFVDGAFWHGHPSRHRPGRSGAYWDDKIATNVARDRRIDCELEAAGWQVIRLWDFELRRSPRTCIATITGALLAAANSKTAPAPSWLDTLAGIRAVKRPDASTEGSHEATPGSRTEASDAEIGASEHL